MPPTRTSPEVSSQDNDNDEDILNDMLGEPPSEDISPRARKLPTQPQSFSDPVEIHPKTTTPQAASSPPNIDSDPPSPHIDNVPKPPVPDASDTTYIPVEDSGPWTSTEAFLLFDRWPPGRQKPSYVTATSLQSNVLASGNSGTGGRNGQGLSTSMMSKKKYGTFGSAKFVSQR